MCVQACVLALLCHSTCLKVLIFFFHQTQVRTQAFSYVSCTQEAMSLSPQTAFSTLQALHNSVHMTQSYELSYFTVWDSETGSWVIFSK